MVGVRRCIFYGSANMMAIIAVWPAKVVRIFGIHRKYIELILFHRIPVDYIHNI